MFQDKKIIPKGPLRPDPELWEALGEGELLKVILTDFYDRVFDDERLAHFFEGVTKEYVAQKQYGFLRSILTAKACYYGARPRNAHHWMVISGELFDHREEVLAKSLRLHGVEEKWIVRVREIDEAFRKQIVKNKPRTQRIGGVELPLDGLGEIEVTVAFVCDVCCEPLEVGDKALYSVRTSQTCCISCGVEAFSAPLPNSESKDSSADQRATDPDAR